MVVRKLSANKIFTGTRMIDQGVLIINPEGKVLDLVPQTEAGDDIELFDGIISPGFVNMHCHLELSYLHGKIDEKTGLVDFLLEVLKKKLHPSQSIIEMIAKAENEMLQNGIVAVGDICNTTDTLEQKKLANLYYYSFIEVAGFLEINASERYQQGESLYEHFSATDSRLTGCSIVPHAPYSVSRSLMSLISQQNKQHLVSIHNQESAEENKFFRDGTGDFKRLYAELDISLQNFVPPGVSSFLYFLPYFMQCKRMILVHNVATSENDLNFATSNGFFSKLSWCLCPNANLYISAKLPDVVLLKKYNAHLVIGTDSLASNHQLSILAELKTLQQHFPFLTISEMLQWATFNGAQALDITNRFGSLDKGKSPGIVLIENVSGNSLKNAICRRLI